MQIRVTNGQDETTELISVVTPDIDAEEFKYTDVDGDKLEIFTAVIPDLGAGINVRTDQLGASFPLADVPKLIGAIWAKAQQAAHFHGQLPCPHPNCGPCSFDRATPKEA